MGLGIGILLTVIAMAVVAWPLVRRRPGAAPEGTGAADAFRRARAEIYGQMRQLDLDHRAGLVTETDHRVQFDEFRTQAARLMMEEATSIRMAAGRPDGGSAGTADMAAELEREIAEARAARARSRGGPGGRTRPGGEA